MSNATFVRLDKILVPPISGGRPSGGVSSGSEGIPSVGGENIRPNGGMDYEGVRRIPESFYNLMPKGKLQRLDVLINKDGAQTGKVGIYDGAFDKAAVNEHVFILRGENPADIDQTYLFYCILLPETQQKIYRRITGSAQPGLNSQFVRAVDIPIRGIAKQQKIARILQTIDRAIERTEALIDKYQQIKAGLMHDLFTRGIGPDGQLRPPREQAPHRYQQTPIGWIPKEWEVRKGNECFSLYGGVSPEILSESSEGSLLYVKVDDFNNPENSDEIVVSQATFDSSSANQRAVNTSFSTGVVVFPKRGAAIFKNRAKILGKKGTVDPNLMVASSILLKPELLSKYLVFLDLSNICDNSGLPQINNKHLYPHYFPVPSISEQEMMAEKIKIAEKMLKSEKARLDKITQQKSGLMHDLLTGNVSVTPDPEPDHG